ncbi:purine nucleoside phosphorylase-like, partial [Gallus gallus]|uniref:purine nucleoside phosphorylase-like n=1 Tax=Gallus gallus TaxID=9031 RepID=UPI001F02BFF1
MAAASLPTGRRPTTSPHFRPGAQSVFTMDGSYECCSEAAAWLGSHFGGVSPRVGLVCGSGLGALAEDLGQPHSVDYADIPHFPRSTVSGHAGRLVVGTLGSVPCAVLQGRFHLYEGYSPAQV